MDEIMNKVGAYWLGQRANKEISSAGDDLEVRETKPSHPTPPLLFLAAYVWLNFCFILAPFSSSKSHTQLRSSLLCPLTNR